MCFASSSQVVLCSLAIFHKRSPDSLEVVYDVAILSMVGIGMKYNSTVIADAVWALKENHIDIEMLDHGPAKISFHIGVAQQHADKALELLYEKLVNKR